jgi:hypothetical protein
MREPFPGGNKTTSDQFTNAARSSVLVTPNCQSVANKVTELINVRKTQIVKKLDVVMCVSRLDIFHQIVLTNIDDEDTEMNTNE